MERDKIDIDSIDIINPTDDSAEWQPAHKSNHHSPMNKKQYSPPKPFKSFKNENSNSKNKNKNKKNKDKRLPFSKYSIIKILETSTNDTNYSENDIYDILDMYFNEILEVIEFGHFDSLAHFNYPIKYITKCFGIKLKTEKICQKVRMVLDHLVKSNKALEISSSPDFSGDNSILSNENLLTEFKNLGGKYITIGSGAHKCSHMGKNLDNVFNLILNSGFDKFTIFKNRIPIMLPIISE